MAKKGKQVNYREMDVDELNQELQKTRQSLFKLQFRAASAPVKNVNQMRQIRRNVARVMTFINQKRRKAG